MNHEQEKRPQPDDHEQDGRKERPDQPLPINDEAQPYARKIDLTSAVDDVQKMAAFSADPGMWPRELHRRPAFYQGPWVLIAGFALIIVIGGALLKLPWAAETGVHISWGDALFTATSAVTVTGLAVRNTANDFSFFGEIVILFLLQVGGVGFIAFSVLFFRLIGRRINLQNRFIIQQSLGVNQVTGALRLAIYILGVTLAIEGMGALLLWLRWRTRMPDGEAIWYALFHSISSYCNAGFDLFSGAGKGVLFGFGDDWYTLAVMGTLILLGGFGITVLWDIWSYPFDRTLGLNTRFTLIMAATLTLVGIAIFMADPVFHETVLQHLPLDRRFAVAFFSIVSARTAGLTILPIDQLSEATQLVIMLWMFIGGSPASMAGGVSTSTVAVLLFAVIATARGHDESVAFKRTIPTETIAKAVAIMTVSTLVVVAITMFLSLNHEGQIFTVGFEVVSAFSNTGYSLDFTSHLDGFGRFLIAFTMFWGRLGPLTVVIALAQRQQPNFVRYPEEPIILG
jgi:trk system potassium uptake protein TrkH